MQFRSAMRMVQLQRQLFVSAVMLAGAGVAIGQSTPAAESSVKQTVARYVQAWNTGDLAALSQMWLPDGELVDQQGTVIDRRALMAARKAAAGGRRPVLAIDLQRVRVVAPDVALIDGESRLAAPDGARIQATRFFGVLVEQNGTWRIRLIRQLSTQQAPPAADPLKELGWLVGEWVALGDGLRVQDRKSVV